jgi:type III secretion system FlhB-like substrate exporter
MNNRKTERKNKTNQTIVWPSNEEYFTIDSLIQSNPHMLTASGSDITLRVRLSNAIKNSKSVIAIGTRNCGKGRPKLAFVMTPVTPSVLDKAKAEGIMLFEENTLVNVMQLTPITNTVPVNPAPKTAKEVAAE